MTNADTTDTMSLVEAASLAFAAALRGVVPANPYLIVIAVDGDGAYQIRATNMNVNTTIGVLTRAAIAISNTHSTPYLVMGGSAGHPPQPPPPAPINPPSAETE